MTTMLAQRKGEWFLAAFAPHLHGCNLSTTIRPQHDRDKFHLWRGHTYVWSHAPLDSITLYPELRYQGLRVYPEHWHRESTEPLMHCRMMGDQITHATPRWGEYVRARDAMQAETARRHMPDDDPLRLRWLEAIRLQSEAAAEIRRKLVVEGWNDGGGEGLTRYVHVDDLEKIEGPPPQEEL